jgi:GNAT superfamily N-acetyltransferase
MVSIVPATYAHLPALRLCFARLTAERQAHYPAVDPEELDRFLLLMSGRIDAGHQTACCLVAETDGGKLLGFTSLQLAGRDVGKPRVFAFMEWIGVNDGARKLGVGRELVVAALDWAQARGVAHIEGNVLPGPEGPWARGAETYAARQVITIAEARASVLVPAADRPPEGASASPPVAATPTPRKRRKVRRTKPARNGHAPEAMP